MSKIITPYDQSTQTKKKQVEVMFDNIADRYDALNQILSAGIHKKWRKKIVKQLEKKSPHIILDVATGTGDVAIALSDIKTEKIIGIDISEKMLERGREKINNLNLSGLIQLQKGDSENIEFPENYFDAATASFGVRNFENLELGLSNMYRVLKPGGTIVILEFGMPDNKIIRNLYNFYFSNIMPLIGRKISKDQKAYRYLFESVDAFPYGNDFKNILAKTGFSRIQFKKLSLGIAYLYTAQK